MFGLNRTMQYGNEKKSNIKKTKIIGLNRTMQYGNKKAKKFFAQKIKV